METIKLDCRGLICPLPVVSLAQRVKEIELGDLIDFYADDASCVQDLPAWCGATGNELVSLEKDGIVIHAVIRRGAK